MSEDNVTIKVSKAQQVSLLRALASHSFFKGDLDAVWDFMFMGIFRQQKTKEMVIEALRTDGEESKHAFAGIGDPSTTTNAYKAVHARRSSNEIMHPKLKHSRKDG